MRTTRAATRSSLIHTTLDSGLCVCKSGSERGVFLIETTSKVGGLKDHADGASDTRLSCSTSEDSEKAASDLAHCHDAAAGSARPVPSCQGHGVNQSRTPTRQNGRLDRTVRADIIECSPAPLYRFTLQLSSSLCPLLNLFFPSRLRLQNIFSYKGILCGIQIQTYYHGIARTSVSGSGTLALSMNEDDLTFSLISSNLFQEVLIPHQTSHQSRIMIFAATTKTLYLVGWSHPLKRRGMLTNWRCWTSLVSRMPVSSHHRAPAADSAASRRTTQYGATLSDDGAHIILPQGAQLFELGLHHKQLFENYAREHGAEWLERFRDRLGWPRSNSIYLLTGFYKTCSWSIASFGMQTAANTDPVRVHCTLVEVDERTMPGGTSVWQPAGRLKCKIGPPPDRQGLNNQTIFIRAITVTPNLSEQEPGEQREAGLLGTLFSLTRSLSSLTGDSNLETATETPKSNVIIQHVPQISQANFFLHHQFGP